MKDTLVSPSNRVLDQVLRVNWNWLTNGDMIVIIDGNEIAELQMASKTGSFASNSFHGTSISKEHVSVVIDQVKVWLVEDSSGVSLRDSETDCVGEALAEWTCGHFDAFSIMGFGMTGCDAIDCLAWY